MKKTCKNIDITDVDFIKNCVRQCLRKKRKRKDLKRYISGLYNDEIDTQQINNALLHPELPIYEDIVNIITRQIREELLTDNIKLPPIHYFQRVTETCQKLRTIGNQNVKQHIYDFILVYGLKDELKRIGKFQVASLPGKGQVFGMKHVSRWCRSSENKYALKCDIKKCYESVNTSKLIMLLLRNVKNPKLMDLAVRILSTYKGGGLNIGSYLSQHMCNYYLSYIYHFLEQNAYKIVNHKDGTTSRENFFNHMLFYMDDIILIGSNKRNLLRALSMLKEKAAELDLTVKPEWLLLKLKDQEEYSGKFLDTMGYRIFKNHVNIRRGIYRNIRRMVLRCKQKIENGQLPSKKQITRLMSYHGFIVNSDSYKIIKLYNYNEILTTCKLAIRYYNHKISKRLITYEGIPLFK